jgi:integrase
MANVKFLLRTKTANSKITVRFYDGRLIDFRKQTRETINSSYWNDKKGFPKKLTSLNPNDEKHISELNDTLKGLETYILEHYRKRNDTEIINGEWFEEIINAYYNGGRRIEQLEYIENYLDHYRKEILPFRKYKGQPVSKRTLQKQSTTIDKFLEFLKSQSKRLKVSDYNLAVSNKFVQFLRSQNLNDNTAGKYLKYTKTIFKDAKIENIQVNDQLGEIKGFTAETPTPYLTETEILKIQNLKLIGNEKFEITRDWLIIGCYTGQRASDLFNMNIDRITHLNGKDFINLNQKKTKTPVLIPIHNEVKKILDKRNGQFPPKFTDNIESAKTIFNTYLKKIVKLAEIDRLQFGRKYDAEKKHFIFGDYPMHEIVSSHICRRTFATMYYTKIPTSIIRAVTGHKTETEFLQYIGVDNNELSEQMYTHWERLDNLKNDTESQTKTAN